MGENGADRSTLWLVNEDGKELHTPFPDLDRASDLQWSALGEWLGFTFTQGAQQGLRLYNPFTDQERLVPNSYPGPWRWAADGSQLAFFCHRG